MWSTSSPAASCALLAPGALTCTSRAGAHCHLHQDSSIAPLQKLPLSGLEIFLPQFSSSVLWQHSPEPGLAVLPCQLCHGEGTQPQGSGIENFGRSKGWVWAPSASNRRGGGWHHCHWQWEEVEQRGG